MSDPASDSRQFYLGVGGNQTGPFSEQEVLDQLARGQVPADALVWFEGLPDWQPLSSIEYFQGAVPSSPSEYASPPPAGGVEEYSATEDYATQDYGNIESQDDGAYGGEADYGGGGDADLYGGMGTQDAPASQGDPVGLMSSSGSMQPVFESGGGGGKNVAQIKRLFLVMVSLGTMSLVAVYVYNEFLAGPEGPQTFALPTNTQANAPKQPRITPEIVRRRQLQTAQSELLLKPNEAAKTLQDLIRADSKDAVGKAAVESLLDFYKVQRRSGDSGRLMMLVGRPLEASQFFLAEPPSYPEAEEALFAAYQQSKEATRQDLLIQNIRINLNKLRKTDVATERIRILEKEFPGAGKEFAYYLKSPAKRIEDLYNRLSFYFVQQLLLFIDAEFPQLSLVERPKVSVEREGNNYRIVGRYKGAVLLQQDRLKNIVFTFWLDDLNWMVVETNLTPERRKWAGSNRRLLSEKKTTEAAMLTLLEALFKRQYPSKGLHEIVEKSAASPE